MPPALMEGSLDAIERIADNSNGLSDGRATPHRTCHNSLSGKVLHDFGRNNHTVFPFHQERRCRKA
jgi:hypothetical protein